MPPKSSKYFVLVILNKLHDFFTNQNPKFIPFLQKIFFEGFDIASTGFYDSSNQISSKTFWNQTDVKYPVSNKIDSSWREAKIKWPFSTSLITLCTLGGYRIFSSYTEKQAAQIINSSKENW